MQSPTLANGERTSRTTPVIQVNDVSEVLGAEITGLDIGDDASVSAHWDRIQTLLRDRHLLLFRDQTIDEDDLARFATRFGEFERSVTQRPDGSFSKPVHMITNFDAQGKPSPAPATSANYQWHSDKAFLPTGSAMVMLYGMELPPSGGDTQFANMQLAYEALSDADKTLIADLRVVHSFEYVRVHVLNKPMTDDERKTVPGPRQHPLVRTDPQTGRKSLYLGMYAEGIAGMSPEDGRALIERLHNHATQPRFVYTHKWRKGDFFAWNNLSLLHRAMRNYEMGVHRRVMMRCGIKSNQIVQ